MLVSPASTALISNLSLTSPALLFFGLVGLEALDDRLVSAAAAAAAAAANEAAVTVSSVGFWEITV